MKILTAEELRSLATTGLDIIDVRDPHEWLSGHVPGARLVPLAQLQADPRGALPRDDIAFVCAKGGRSAVAAEIAERIGRASVFSLEGGTDGWREAGLPIVVPDVARPDPGASVRDPDELPLDVIVGSNLKLERVARGWSLDDLAREAGISRTVLGQIEIGQTEPSIGNIWKIAHAMGMPFSTLLANPGSRTGTRTTTRRAAKKLTGTDGRFTTRALYSVGDPDAAEFYELWMAPHSREDAEPHRIGTRENLVVASGSLELLLDRDVVHLSAGDSTNFAADQPHSYINRSSQECWMYLVMNYARTAR